MSVLDKAIRINTPADLANVFSNPQDKDRSTLLLSASVPYERTSGTKRQMRDNLKYLAESQPERIRLAVRELTQSALLRGIRLVFGAHPAISPMVLEAARTLPVKPGSILIFQSELFANRIPHSTLDLADWSKGLLILTPVINPGAPDSREKSLEAMRRLMVSTPGLCGAVFIGGMDGTEDEADLFHTIHPGLPRYAIASTGSAASFLFNRSKTNQTPQTFAGRQRALNPEALSRYPVSYKLTARMILDDLGFTVPP